MKFFIPLLFIIPTFLQAQFLPIEHQVALGGNNEDLFVSIDRSPDGGYFVLATSKSAPSGVKTSIHYGEEDLWLLKLDANLNIVWQKSYGGNMNEVFPGMVVTDDAIYLYCSTQSSNTGNKTLTNFGLSDTWVLRLDFDGNILWQQALGGSDREDPSSLIEYTDTSLLVSIDSKISDGNKTTPYLGGGSDIWLVELSKTTGAIIAQKTIGGIYNEGEAKLYKIGNYIYMSASAIEGISMDKTINGFGHRDLWLVKFDQHLNIVDQAVFGGIEDDQNPLLFFNNNNIYLLSNSFSEISGNKTSEKYGDGYNDVWLIKLDFDFSIVWQQSFGGSNFEGRSNLILLPNDQLLLTLNSISNGSTGNKSTPNIGRVDVWTVLIDHQGNILQEYAAGGTGDDSGGVYYLNNTFIFAGTSESPVNSSKTVQGNGMYDVWLGKATALDILSTQTIQHEQVITVYPNPFTHSFTVDIPSSTENYVLTLYAVDGTKVYQTVVPPNQNSVQLSEVLPVGVYQLTVTGNQATYTRNLIKL